MSVPTDDAPIIAANPLVDVFCSNSFSTNIMIAKGLLLSDYLVVSFEQ